MGFICYLFVSIFYQKFFGTEPFNNSFSIGLPRFYFEFYSGDCVKLNGSSFINLILNILIYITLVMIYYCPRWRKRFARANK